MKRILCLILISCLLLSGCSYGERIKDPVTFYYLCDNYKKDLCCVIVSEDREAAGHVGDLPYLLALYLMGPTTEEYVAPLPSGLQIRSTQEADHIYLELIGLPPSLSEIDFSLKCACLTLTCLDITGAEYVTIHSGERTRTMSRDSLTLYDTAEEPAPTEETQ